MLGTNFVNFVGLHAWVGEAGGISAVQVTEWDEPQAVIGSYLHRYAYPDWYAAHQANGDELKTAHDHAAGDANCLQLRGEYLYVAEGSDGARVYDVASIAQQRCLREDHHGAVQPAWAGHAHCVEGRDLHRAPDESTDQSAAQ